MKFLKKFFFIIMILALVAVPVAFNAKPAFADPVYTCLPTCEVDDGRFLAISGTGLATIVGVGIIVEFSAPAGATNIDVGIFDGENSGLWDVRTEEFEYTLFADPLGNGTGTVILGQAMGSDMPDNDWFTFNISTGPEAMAPSGNFFYRLRILAMDPEAIFANRFKVRSDGVVSLQTTPFAYIAPLSTMDDVNVIYPNYPDLSVTTYDGSFDFHAYAPNSVSSYPIWDGDVDFGSADFVDNDTDDPDTPNDVLPPWATTGTALEGVAVGFNGSTGQPSDDSAYDIYRRGPSVIYDLAPLNEIHFFNYNPSGNIEWEQFRIETNQSIPADYYVDSRLPAGLYHLHLEGMDLSNLNAWRLPYKVVGVCEFDPDTNESNPCKDPLHPYKIGDTVFKDRNGNGVQDDDEPGRPGVVLYLFDGHGYPILDIANNPISTVTDLYGKYEFDVEPYTEDFYTGEVTVEGIYTVQVGAENFVAGGALAGLVSTTGGNSQTDTVIDANVMEYDFGYGLTATTLGVADYAYWANNPDAWPVDEVTIGGITYLKADAIELMTFKSGQDWTYKLFRELVAAKLNVEIGNVSSCIDASITAADVWMAQFPVGSNVKYKSAEWNAIKDTYYQLRNYNLGLLCAPPM